MSRKQNQLSNNLNESCNSEYSSSEDQKYASLKSSYYTISIESDEEKIESDNDYSNITSEKEKLKEDSNYISVEKKEKIRPDKKIKYNPKKKSDNSFHNKKNNYHISSSEKENKLSRILNKNNKSDSNTKYELDSCYKQLDHLFSKYSFTEISQIIIKLFNNIEKGGKDNAELFKKIKKIICKIKKKETITMMSLSILSSKILNNKNINSENVKKEKEDKIKNRNNENIKIEKDNKKKKEKIIKLNEEIESEEDTVEKNEIKKNPENFEFINSFKNMPVKKYLFGKHYSNYQNKYYCYFSKTLLPRYTSTLFCSRRFDGCKAKCKVKNNSNNITIIGKHNHTFGLSHSFIYQKFPFLKNLKWKDIQIVKEKNKKIFIYQG